MSTFQKVGAGTGTVNKRKWSRGYGQEEMKSLAGKE